MSFVRERRLWYIILLAIAAMAAGCAGDGQTPATDSGVCDRFDIESCDCPYGTGFRRCLPDTSGFGECQCAVKNATLANNAVNMDKAFADTPVLEGERGLKLPPGTESDALQPGAIIVSWDAGLMGRITSVVSRQDGVVIDTEPCAITDAFEELSMEFNGKLPIASQMPEDVKEYLRKRAAARKKEEEQDTEFELPAGVSFDVSGNLDVGIDIDDKSFLDFEPDLYMKLKIKDFQLNHLAVVPSIDLDLLLALQTELKAECSATAEIEIFEAIMAAITGDPEIGPFRTWIGGGFELEVFFTIGALLELDAFVNVGTELTASTSAYGGVLYSKDWNDAIWSDVRSEIKEAKKTWENKTWHPVGEGSFTSDVRMTEFTWGAHGGLELYMQPKLGLTFLRCGGPTVDVQPYGRFDAWVGDKNKLEAKIGIRGHAGGKLELFGEETLWEDSWELFDEYQVIWRYSWILCGDGLRTLDCYDNLNDCEGGDCPLIDSGCAGVPEECDAGIFARMPGQGAEDSLGDAKPCIPPGQPGACTCGVGWKPATGDEWFWSDLDEDDYQWGDRHNWCVRTCGNGVVEPDEGEVCDHNGAPGCDGGCNEDCTAPASVCGNGIKECYEECDDGNTDNCDGCSEYCTEEPGTGGCGDGYRCGAEECDDGNEEDCDQCHNDCTDNSGCTDGHLCGDEVCDDGNIVDCDQCHNDCTANTGCGDGHRCGNEACDDGNLQDCDECSALCIVTGCGDGAICGDEVCDDGNRVGGDGCRADCMGTEVCGDGRADWEAGEQCDDGNADECDACHSDCTIFTDVCGDGFVCGDEVCDDGNLQPGDGCSTNCMSDETCGNGITDTAAGEVCDDGNQRDCDTCSADCKHEITGCGDGVLCGDEVCDDGNTTGGDGCRADCMGTEVCGDGLLDTGEACEDTTEEGIDAGCPEASPDCVLECGGCTPRCGDGVVGAGETCDVNPSGTDINCSDQTPVCSADCRSCVVDCSDNICGDGKKCPGEACDDGNLTDCDACSADCLHRITGCGDGVLCGDEICDDGNTTGGDGCRADCMGTETCGDGLLDVGESCDNDTTDGTDLGCTVGAPDCVLECRGCTPRCGDGIVGPGEGCEDSSATGMDDNCTAEMPVCRPDCSQCVAFICGDDVINPPEVCDGAPLSCTDEVTGYRGEQECLPGCIQAGPCIPVEYCGDGEKNGPEACDDADNDSCTRACSADCMHENLPETPVCGNGILECGEVCDDGNTESTDGCSGDCLSDETCGNQYVDVAVGEQCDDGNHIGEDGCSADCLSNETCGNGRVDDFRGEVCDDGNTDDCIGNCAADCMSMRAAPVCGDGTIDELCEVCEDSDPGNQTVDSGCTPEAPNCNNCDSCTADVCGDGIIGSTEDCDEGGMCSDNDSAFCTTLDMSNCIDPLATCNSAPYYYPDGGICARDCVYFKCGDLVVASPWEACEDTVPDNTGIDAGCSETFPDCSSNCGYCDVQP